MHSTAYLGALNQRPDITAGITPAAIPQGARGAQQASVGARDDAIHAAQQFANVPDAACTGRARRALANDSIAPRRVGNDGYIASIPAPHPNLFSRLIELFVDFIQDTPRDSEPFNPDSYQRHLHAVAAAGAKKFADSATRGE